MPRRELRNGQQVHNWIQEVAVRLTQPGNLILIGSAALLWHAHDRAIVTELPEASMDIDPLTDSDEVARICYDGLIGSDFEREHGFHINLMPDAVLNEFPSGWRERSLSRRIGLLTLTVPQAGDLLAPKLKRGEPRDIKHAEWAKEIGLLDNA
jgi:hypothetical protein